MLAAEKLVLLVIFMIVLIASLYIIGVMGMNSAGQTSLQNDLRSCCGTYRASGCNNLGLICNSQTGDTIGDVQTKLSMQRSTLDCFCKCPGACA